MSSLPTLDGRSFVDVVLERGKTSGDGDGAYRWQQRDGQLSFEAETESAKYGQLRWQGVVRGARLDGTLTMVRDGQAAGEKWVLAGEVEPSQR